MKKEEHKFKVIAFADNQDGSKIFCRLTMDKKTLVKGFYDFNKELFFITEYVKRNFIEGVGKNKARRILKEILEIDYDWILADSTNTKQRQRRR